MVSRIGRNGIIRGRTKGRKCNACSVMAGLLSWSLSISDAGDAELRLLLEKMAKDVHDFGKAIEETYYNRCNRTLLEKCARSNYDSCVAMFPSPSCPGGSQLTIPECGNGVQCGGLFDYTISSVRIPPSARRGYDDTPLDPGVIETVCYTQQVDDWLVRRHDEDFDFWAGFGVDSPQMHFGALNGAFRIYPARHSKTCVEYDPRKRPWFIAGSSGPKNIVLVLDVSGSMGDHNGLYLHLMKQAASNVIDSMTESDRVTVVTFSDATNILLDDDILLSATAQNKKTVLSAIANITADGSTNFTKAFDTVFDAIDRTTKREKHTRCNSAILFFTDHDENAAHQHHDKLIPLIQQRKAVVEQTVGHPLFLFTYSLGDSPGVHTLPKQIACATGGLWTKINAQTNLVESMSSYYKLFAIGFGREVNENFSAWVEPYVFATGQEWGTTISKPVYDMTVQPHLFLGVVGVDFTLAAMNKALGVNIESVGWHEIVRRSNVAQCPKLNLSLCQLESLRRQGGGDEALCTEQCSEHDFVGIEPERCFANDDDHTHNHTSPGGRRTHDENEEIFPSYLWANAENRGKTFEQRTCCVVGDQYDTLIGQTECPVDDSEDHSGKNGTDDKIPPNETTPPQGLTAGRFTTSDLVAVAFGSVGCTLLIIAFFWFCCSKERREKTDELLNNHLKYNFRRRLSFHNDANTSQMGRPEVTPSPSIQNFNVTKENGDAAVPPPPPPPPVDMDAFDEEVDIFVPGPINEAARVFPMTNPPLSDSAMTQGTQQQQQQLQEADHAVVFPPPPSTEQLHMKRYRSGGSNSSQSYPPRLEQLSMQRYRSGGSVTSQTTFQPITEQQKLQRYRSEGNASINVSAQQQGELYPRSVNSSSWYRKESEDTMNTSSTPTNIAPAPVGLMTGAGPMEQDYYGNEEMQFRFAKIQQQQQQHHHTRQEQRIQPNQAASAFTQSNSGGFYDTTELTKQQNGSYYENQYSTDHSPATTAIHTVGDISCQLEKVTEEKTDDGMHYEEKVNVEYLQPPPKEEEENVEYVTQPRNEGVTRKERPLSRSLSI